MTRDPLTDPQPGDVVRARDGDAVGAWFVLERDGDSVRWSGCVSTWSSGVESHAEPVAEWADWTDWQSVTAIPAEAP